MSNPQCHVELRLDVRIPMRDGVHLSALHYMPADTCLPRGAICALTPYTAQTLHERGVYFAGRGFSFLAIDVRGRGNSEGIFEPFKNEALDASDAVAWIAEQPFCNGRVAMWGGSYSGYVQWVAAGRSKLLAGIAPVAAPSFGADFPGRRAIPSPYLAQWLALVWGRTAQDRFFADDAGYWRQRLCQFFESGAAFTSLCEHFGFHSPAFDEWIKHPDLSSYWDGYNPTPAQYAEITTPVLTITGVYDSDQPGALAHYRAHTRHSSTHASHHLIIGPWDHPGTRSPQTRFGGIEVAETSCIDLNALHADWYAWVFGTSAKPAFLSAPVKFYMMVADEWRDAPSLDAVTGDYQGFYLNGPRDLLQRRGALSEKIDREASSDCYIYDPNDVSFVAFEALTDPYDLTDVRMLDARAPSLLFYETEPFDEATDVAGFARAELWLSIDQPDTDFSITLYEVDADGRSTRLAGDRMRARYRTDARNPAPTPINIPLLYDFDQFTFLARRIRAGCRLLCVVGPIQSIHAQKNYNSGGEVAEECARDARVVTVRLHHGENHPSRLFIPLARPATAGNGAH